MLNREGENLPQAFERQPSFAPDPLHAAEAGIETQKVRRLQERRHSQSTDKRVHGDAELGEGGGALEHIVVELVQTVHRKVELAQRRQRAQKVLGQAGQPVAGEVEARHRGHGVECAGLDEGEAAVLAFEAVDAVEE